MLVANGACHNHCSGIGGGFVMNIYKKEEGKAYTLDAREVAPMAATHDMYDLTCMKRMTCEGKPSMFYFPYMKTNIQAFFLGGFSYLAISEDPGKPEFWRF